MPISTAPEAGKRKTLIFHIGDRKTGSTSIQYALAQKRVTVEGCDLYYGRPLNHNYLSPHFRALASGRPKARKTAEARFAKLADNIKKSSARFAIVSAEEFESIPASQLKTVIDSFFSDCADEIRIIGYVRPHAQRILSSFAEQIKLGKFQGDLDKYFTRSCVKNNRFFYHERFQEWQSCFGDQFTLRPFVRSQLENGSVLDDFCKIAFAGHPFKAVAAPAQNSSFSLEDLLRVQVLQGQFTDLSKEKRFALGWEFSRALAHVGSDTAATKVQLHKPLARKIARRFRADAKAMDTTFFGDAPVMEAELEQALAQALDKKQSFTPEDHFSQTDLRSLAMMGHVIETLIQNPKGNWPQYLKQQRINDLHPPQSDTSSAAAPSAIKAMSALLKRG